MMGVFNAFLTEHEGTLSSNAFGNIQRHFSTFLRDHPGALVLDVSKSTFIKWLKSPKPGQKKGSTKLWSPSGQRDIAASIRRALRWSVDEGMIPKNPLAGLRLEDPPPRDAIITYEEHQAIIADCRSTGYPAIATYLIALRCGARPQQIRMVTARHCVSNAWVFQDHKTKKKTGKALTVYLQPCLLTLSKIMCKAHPSGPLFRNDNGDPWKKDTVSQRFRRIRTRLKMDPAITTYAYRHTFATDALLAGIREPEVAALLGHSSTRMVSKVYGHIGKHADHLQEAARRIGENRIKKSS
jgi:integrase